MNIIETIKEIILDFQQEQLYTGMKRHLNTMYVENKAFICVGVRRSGKSTFLFQIMEEKLKAGINIENVLYINFFDDRLTEIKNNQLNLILESYFSLYPQKKQEKIFCFFDEIQECNGWEPFIARILRTENAEVYITGSSSKMLSKEIATQMRGRSLTWEIFPLSFREFLDFHNAEYEKITSQNRYKIQKLFDDYYLKGGFPETLQSTDHLRIMIHQEYFKTIIHRDIVERFDVIHPKAVIHAAYRLLTSISSLYSINRITAYLKSSGHKISKGFVSECIEWFEDAYFLFSVRLYDRSIARQNVNAKKIYCVDHSLVTSVWPGISEDKGHLLENMVFCHLRKKTDRIFYYRTGNGLEVDFIWFDKTGGKNLVQVCWSMDETKTGIREIKALIQAMNETKITKGIIVNHDKEYLFKEADKTVLILPAWKYFLEK